MKILLLHPQDDLPRQNSKKWDLIVDLARAPAVTYKEWTLHAGCPVVSLYDFAEEIQDLNASRQLLQMGAGYVVDSWGVDWWDVLSVEILPQLQELMLVRRLAKELSANCEICSSRAHPLASVLAKILGARMTIRERRFQSAVRQLRHYRESFSRLDPAQFTQVLEDKFDGEHFIRRHFAFRGPDSDRPVILLPSAYTNVSRTALSYADSLPDHEFLLVLTRSNAKPGWSPPNVRLASLTPYFAPTDKREIALLMASWSGLRTRLVGDAEEFRLAKDAGVFERMPSLIRWGISLRDAWNQIFESQNVIACLCADDSNPLSSVPLILAKKRGLPALGCHHGALDCQMAVKSNHADFYLVKNEMERDYLRRVCGLDSARVVMAKPETSSPPRQPSSRRAAPWLVFFTEPYPSYGWRNNEVYRDLLPRLCSLAKKMELRLIFKLHPLESIKGYRRMLERLIPEQQHHIQVLTGPPTAQLWSNARFAMTVQSSTALQCAALDIPVFLCSWLRDPHSGYVSQYERFGVGQLLHSAEEIAEIPRLLGGQRENFFRGHASGRAAGSAQLAHLFSGGGALPVANYGRPIPANA